MPLSREWGTKGESRSSPRGDDHQRREPPALGFRKSTRFGGQTFPRPSPGRSLTLHRNPRPGVQCVPYPRAARERPLPLETGENTSQIPIGQVWVTTKGNPANPRPSGGAEVDSP
jgi:hypothetical protein